MHTIFPSSSIVAGSAGRKAAASSRPKNHIVIVAAALLALVADGTMRPLNVRAAEGPYQRVENWPQLPPDAQFGLMSAVATDSKDNVYGFQREEPNSKVWVFDSQGKLLKIWGENEFPYGHGLRILRDGFIWLTDKKFEQVQKYTLDGKPLLAIGKKGVDGDETSEDAFNGVSDVVMAENGSLFVSDGEGKNARVVKFSKDGKFVKYWGGKGAAPGQFNTPHSIAMDSKGRVLVADRTNKRIQIFDQDGQYLSEITSLGAPTGLYITKDDTLYVTASDPDNRITIGTMDGKILERIEGLKNPHAIAVDATGAMYVAETRGKSIVKFVRKPPSSDARKH